MQNRLYLSTEKRKNKDHYSLEITYNFCAHSNLFYQLFILLSLEWFFLHPAIMYPKLLFFYILYLISIRDIFCCLTDYCFLDNMDTAIPFLLPYIVFFQLWLTRWKFFPEHAYELTLDMPLGSPSHLVMDGSRKTKAIVKLAPQQVFIVFSQSGAQEFADWNGFDFDAIGMKKRNSMGSSMKILFPLHSLCKLFLVCQPRK